MRTRLFYLISIGLLTLGISFDASVVYAQKRSSSDCLEVDDYLTNHDLIDLSSSSYITDASNEISVNQIIKSYSPDKQFVAYIPISNSNDLTYRLFLKRNILNGPILLLQDNVKINMDFQWSHDSHWLAYTWQSGDGISYLSLIERRTGVQKNYQIDTVAGDIINSFGWSSDNKYVAIARSNRNTDPQEIMILSAPDLQLVKTISEDNEISWRSPADDYGEYLQPDALQWSPFGDWLSYLTVANNSTAINLVSISSGQTFHNQVPNFNSIVSSITQMMFWSPSGKYVAFLTATLDPDYEVTEHMKWRLDILGIDGSQFRNVTSTLSQQTSIAGGTLTNPVVAWSADGTAILYAQNNLAQDRGHADLMVFQLDQHRSSLIQPNILLNPGMSTDNRYMVYAWSKNNQSYTIDLLDTNTFSHIRTQDILNATLPDLSITSGTGSWMIVYEGSIPAKAINAATKTIRDLVPFYPSDDLITTNDNGYLAAIIGDNSSYELDWLSLDNDHSTQITLDAGQFDSPSILAVSDDGQEIAILSNATTSDHVIVTIVHPDGSIVQRLDILIATSDFSFGGAKANFIQCELF